MSMEPQGKTSDTRRMSLRGVALEAVLNVTSGTTRAALFAVLLAAVIFGCAGAEFLQLREINMRVREFVSSGASTVLVEYAGRIDGAACESLASVDGVQAAGALRAASARPVAEVLPMTPLPALEATPGAVELLASGDSMETHALSVAEMDGVWLSTQAAEVVGAQVGDTVPLSDGSRMHIAGIYASPEDGRTGNTSYAVVMPVHSTSVGKGFDVCMVKAWPVPRSLESLALMRVRELSGNRDDQPHVRQLNATLGSKLESERMYASRGTVHMPWMACALAMALGFAAIWSRRLEFASALHCGVPKLALMAQSLLETMSWEIMALAICSPLFTVAWLGWEGADGMQVIMLMGRSAIGALAGAICGALIAVLCVRERNLFRYFKGRG